MKRLFLYIILAAAISVSCNQSVSKKTGEQMIEKKLAQKLVPDSEGKVFLTDEEWRAVLSQEEYQVLRQCGTEPPFTGKYNDHHDEGIYICNACGNELFSSDKKYNSGSGWPSFFAPVDSSSLSVSVDTSHGMSRLEIKCGRCDGHLGHLFDDGPNPTGQRYCVNSASLNFKDKKSD